MKICEKLPVALGIFHETTSAAVKSYFPDCQDVASFLSLFNVCWTICNSKSEYNSNNSLGYAAVPNDKTPAILRAMAKWLNKLAKFKNSKL